MNLSAATRKARLDATRRLVAGLVAGLLAAATVVTAAPAAHAAEPEGFVLHGSGFGHGVGMPQYGAYEMSRSGAAISGRAILKHYYTGSDVAFKDTRKQIQVQVFGPDPYGRSSRADRSTSTTVTIQGGDWRLRDMNYRTIASGSSPERLTVRALDDGRVRIEVNGKRYTEKRLRIQWEGTRYWRRNGPVSVATVEGSHGSYRHGRLTARTVDGVVNLTNDVLLNSEYLYGVAEMPSSWGLAGGRHALSAQAIAARSYVMTKWWKGSCRCHVVDDVRDQNYTGWDKENEGRDGYYGKVWKRAVNATKSSPTRARVLLYGGRPVAAHYFSSSGGRTANSEDVWMSRVPYERSVADPYSERARGNSYSTWTRFMPQDDAQRLFGLDSVAYLRIEERWSSGQIRTISATSPGGNTKYLSGKADKMRRILGESTTSGRSLPGAWLNRTWRQW